MPPTSQNFRHVEKDLWEFLPGSSTGPMRSSRAWLEMVVRNYNPRISCATHFLRLDIERR